MLIYDRPVGNDGLRWKDLQQWWGDTEQIADATQAKRSLYGRLKASLPRNSPPQTLLFDAFFEGFRSAVPNLPALLPEVWLHWKLSVAKAAELCAHSKNEQLAALKKSEREILGAAAEINAKKSNAVLAERTEVIQTRIAKNKSLQAAGLAGPFSLIYADPAWRYAATGKSGSRLRIENQYPTMPTAEICALGVEKICDKDAMLFLWVPSSLLQDGLAVMQAWGFEYVTQAIWHKKSGRAPYMGGIFLQAHETLLVGKRGNGLPAPKPENKVPSVIEAPRGEHSQKPELMYNLFEKMYPAFKDHFVELFARNTRKGWASWGNEV